MDEKYQLTLKHLDNAGVWIEPGGMWNRSLTIPSKAPPEKVTSYLLTRYPNSIVSDLGCIPCGAGYLLLLLLP